MYWGSIKKFMDEPEGLNLVAEKKLSKAAHAFRWAARRAFLLGLQAGSGGNISLRLGPNLYLTKPTGMGLGDCRGSDLVLINGQGQALEGVSKPTKEVMTHLAIYTVRPDVNGIVHYHAPYCTAYAVKSRPLPLPTLHARRILKNIPLIPVMSGRVSGTGPVGFGGCQEPGRFWNPLGRSWSDGPWTYPHPGPIHGRTHGRIGPHRLAGRIDSTPFIRSLFPRRVISLLITGCFPPFLSFCLSP